MFLFASRHVWWRCSTLSHLGHFPKPVPCAFFPPPSILSPPTTTPSPFPRLPYPHHYYPSLPTITKNGCVCCCGTEKEDSDILVLRQDWTRQGQGHGRAGINCRPSWPSPPLAVYALRHSFSSLLPAHTRMNLRFMQTTNFLVLYLVLAFQH